jgi:hypothetical protein
LFANLASQADDLRTLRELALADGDVLRGWSTRVTRLERMLCGLDRMIRTRDPFEARDAYIHLAATHQRTAAYLWVEQLAGAVKNWAEKLGLRSEVFHHHPATQVGTEEIRQFSLISTMIHAA